jgi:predicted ribosome quality control (RQC) complex YloA/Tae2 family protein
VLRRIPGQGYPLNLIELAAGLAAWHSKRRTEGLVPVAYTPRKYVRKGKGMAAGAVRLEREQTVLVAPVDPASLAGAIP